MKPKTKMKNSMLLIFIFVFIFILISVRCNTTEPPPPKASLTLTLEDVSCTEAWVRLQSTNLQIPNSIILQQNGIARITINLTTADTLLYIDSLLPKQTYIFQAASIPHSGGQNPVTSTELSVTTMDTTSHNFTWQTWTFGEHSSSVLYDVAIINENNIWAVGEIYMKDSLGQPDPKRYNAVIWNGNNWNAVRIPYNYQGSDFYHPIQSVYAFGPNDIWFCGNGVVHWDGNNFLPIPIPSNVWGAYQMNKLWGSSSNDLYAVGNGGNIAHYQNGVWTKIESGTTSDIQDIWGIQHNSEPLILSAVSNPIEPGDRKILRIKTSSGVDSISWMSDRRVHSVWMDSKFQLFACGDGMFINSHFNLWKKQKELTFVFTERIRGNSKNDLFVVGDFGIIAHYNGVGWKEYPEASAALVYTSVSMKNNLMVTVGYTQRQAVIQKMIRH